MCSHKQLMKPCRRAALNKRHQRFGKRTRHEQASRGRFPKPYEQWEYDAHAMTACTKTQVQHVVTAVAINLVRIDALLTQPPRGKTRQSNFLRLALHPALPSQKVA
jgi:DNA transposition AAA+ family ATPase